MMRRDDTSSSLLQQSSSSRSSSDDSAVFLTPAQRKLLAKYHSKRPPLDKYDVGPMLGKGSSGTVRLLRNPKTGARYACKQVALPRNDRRNIANSIRDEALLEVYALCGLKHPGIAGLVEYHESEHAVYILTELLQGDDLRKAVAERGSLPEEDARSITQRLLEAVRYMHSQGVVHRDLKLENIALADESDLSSVKIIDFGLACRSMTTSTDAGSPLMAKICGSPAYVAPEVVRTLDPAASVSQRLLYGKECDLWSMGVTLFIMLSGYFPFDGLSVHQVLEQVAIADFDFGRDPVWELVSPEAKDLVRGLLTCNPAARLTVEEALQHPWLNDCKIRTADDDMLIHDPLAQRIRHNK